MSKLAQDQEDKVVRNLVSDLETYKKKLVNEFIAQSEIKSTINAENTINENSMAEACKKWGIIRRGGFSALREYNKNVAEMKTLQKEYKNMIENVVKQYEAQIRVFMEDFDNYLLNKVMDSGLFIEVMTNDQITRGKEMKI